MENATQPSATWATAVDRLAAAWGTDGAVGLSEEEARRRLLRDGPNALRLQARVPAWRRLAAQFQDPLVYLLLTASGITTGLWVLEGASGWPVDGLVILCVVVLNATIGFVQENKSQRAAAALARLSGTTATVLRQGVLTRIPSTALVCGDVLVLAEGDQVGADARLIEAHGLRLQEASLTGESEAVLKTNAVLPTDTPLAERYNMVFKDTAVVQGSARALVIATGMQTEMGRITHLLDTTPEEASPLQNEVRLIGKWLSRAVLAIAALVVVTVLLMTEVHTLADVEAVLLLGVSLAVAAVPEGLPAILSLVLAVGVQRMAAQQAIVKQLSSVETLGSASVICTDKTGTLTRAEMSVEKVMTASGCSCPQGVGYVPVGEIHHAGQPLQPGALHSELVVMLSGGSLAGNADLRQDDKGEWHVQGDPTEAALLVAERKLGVHERRQQRFTRIAETPFSSARKRMSVVVLDHEQNDQRVLIVKGAPDVLMPLCTQARVGMDVVPLSETIREQALADVHHLTDAALRTLSVAYRVLSPDEDVQSTEALETDLIFVGTVGIIDPPRTEAAAAIQEAQRAGIRVIMITGDHPRTAARIASDLGIIAAGGMALTGADVDALDDAALKQAVGRTAVYARVDPAHKLRIVDALQSQGHVVAMTGDGVNDAPALKSADIGVAMGKTGTEVSKEAAKMILANDNFATIVVAVREGRGILENIRKCLRYLLSSNMGEVLTVFLGVVAAHALGLIDETGAVVLPLLATQILWINLVTDAAPAMAMGLDPQTDDVMARQPRRLQDRLMPSRMWWSVVQMGLVMAFLCLLTLDLWLPRGWIEGTGSLEQARTAAFTVLVLSQLFNAFNARSETASALQGLWANRWLWAAIGLGVALQVSVVHLAVLNQAFGTVPLQPQEWLVCLSLASGVLLYSEARKWLVRRMPQV